MADYVIKSCKAEKLSVAPVIPTLRFPSGILYAMLALLAGLILLIPFDVRSQTKDSFVGMWHGSGIDVTITRDGEGFVFDCKNPAGSMAGVYKLRFNNGSLTGLGIYGDVAYLQSEDSLLVAGAKLKRVSSAIAAPHEDPLLTEVSNRAKDMFLTNVLQISESVFFEVKSPQICSGLLQAKDVSEETRFSQVSEVDKLNGLECSGKVDFTAKFIRERMPAALIQGSPQGWGEWSEYGKPIWTFSFERKNGSWTWKGEWRTDILAWTANFSGSGIQPIIIGPPSPDLVERPAAPRDSSIQEPAGSSGLAQIREGRAKLLERDYAGAITAFTEAITLNPRRAAGAYEGRGNAKNALKDYQGAIADFDKAIELSPKHAPVYNERGNTKYGLRDYQGAIADYSSAIQLYPKIAVYYDNRGNAKRIVRDYDGAIADYTQAIGLNTTNAMLYDHRAIAKADLKDYYAAIADYTQAIGLNAADGMFYNRRGLAKMGLKDYYGAIADYTQAIASFPKNSFLHENRGNAKRDLKDYEGAIADYIKATDLRTAQFPEESEWSATIRRFLTGTLAESDFLDSAMSVADAPITHRIKVCQASYYAGIKRLSAGDKNGGMDLLSKCLDTGQTNQASFRGAEMELKLLKSEPTK